MDGFTEKSGVMSLLLEKFLGKPRKIKNVDGEIVSSRAAGAAVLSIVLLVRFAERRHGI